MHNSGTIGGIAPRPMRWRLGWLVPIAIALALLVAGVVWIITLPTDLAFDQDEGINLVKARLLGSEARLYGTMWSDQPPLFTLMLAGVERVFGVGAGVGLAQGRILVAALACLLLWAIGDVARRATREAGGDLLATMAAVLLAIGLLAGSHRYVTLAMKVMIGLPAVALAGVATWLLVVGLTRDRPRWRTPCLAGAGAALAAGLLIKLNVFTLLPAAFGTILLANGRANRRRAGAEAAVFAGGLVGGLALLLLVAVPFADLPAAAEQLFGPHLNFFANAPSPTADESQPRLARLAENAHHVVDMIDANLRLVGVVVLAGVIALAGRFGERRKASAPAKPTLGGLAAVAGVVGLIWFATSALVLLFASPVQYHHITLITVPLGFVAAAALGGTFGRLGSASPLPFARVIVLVVAVGLTFGSVTRAMERLDKARDPVGRSMDEEVLAAASGYAGETAFADRPLYALATGLRPIPEVAVATSKRRRRGLMSDELLLRLFERDRPRVVILNRFGYHEPLLTYLEANYTKVFHRPQAPDRPRSGSFVFVRNPHAPHAVPRQP